MSSEQIEAIKSGINDYFKDCEIHNYIPYLKKSEIFDVIMSNYSLQKIITHYNYKDIEKYAYDICYLLGKYN